MPPTCHNKLETSSANTTSWQLVNRLVTTCLQTCNNLCVFTRVIYVISIFTIILWDKIWNCYWVLAIFQTTVKTSPFRWTSIQLHVLKKKNAVLKCQNFDGKRQTWNCSLTSAVPGKNAMLKVSNNSLGSSRLTNMPKILPPTSPSGLFIKYHR